MNLRHANLAYSLVILVLLSFSCGSRDSQYLSAVQTFADNVLEKGIDRWSGKNTPLLADGINLKTDEPLEYVYDGQIGVRGEGGEPNSWIMHNLANQQNLFRTLVALSNLTGDARYREAAERSIRYHFDSLRGECGLLRWGGHQIIDLRTMKPIGHSWRTNVHVHELNVVFPYYKLMWDVDKQATIDFIRSHWNAHVLDWNTLDFNRHGNYGRKMGNLWDHEFKFPEPFFEGTGLTFLISAMDLIYSGGTLYMLNGEEGALKWSKLLADQYVKARHPETGLGTFQFSKPTRRIQPPEGPLTGTLTWSNYGDRAENQFANDFGDVAREGWAIFNGGMYSVPSLVQLELAEMLGEQGEGFLKATVAGIKAYAKYAYDPGNNHFRPIWADGTDLTNYAFARTGYYGPEGRILNPTMANEVFLLTYAKAYRLSKDQELWNVLRSIMKNLDLGDPGIYPKASSDLNLDTENSNPHTLFAMLELQRAVDNQVFLTMAEKIGNNILERSFHKGFFLRQEDSEEVMFNTIEPLALLTLEAVKRGTPDLVPIYSGGTGRINLKTE
jgi:pectate lyase